MDGIKPILLLLLNAALAWWVISKLFKAVGAYTSLRTSQIDAMNERLADIKTSLEKLDQLCLINENLREMREVADSSLGVKIQELRIRSEIAERSKTGSGSA